MSWRAVFLPACVAILLAAALAVPLPLFVERPGPLLSLADHVDVAEDGEAGDIDGDFLLTVVNLRRATVVLLVRGLLDPDTSLLPVGQLTGGLDDAAYFGRQREIFATTAEVASALGLRAAGYPVEFEQPHGVLVADVFPGAPAEGSLEPGDVVTAVGGAQVRSAGELVAAVRDAEGATLEIVFTREDEQRRVEVERGQVPGLEQPGLGVRAEDLVPSIDLPVPVDVDTGRIGGPSAGLMIALTVYDKASPRDLAAGRRVAGTGGVGVDGTVTPMGGIELKVLSASREGADVFLAPDSQVAQAQAAVPDGSSLEVIGVATLEEAIEALGAGERSAARTILADAA